MVEINGVSGTFYQPCIDDVGNRLICNIVYVFNVDRILVQLEPVLDGTYTGMPIYKEIGPLKLNAETQQKAEANLEQQTCDLKVKIESIFFEYDVKAVNIPCEGVITLNKEDQSIVLHYIDSERNKHKLTSCKYSERYPSVDIIKKTSSSFELQFGPIDIVKLSTENNLDRDALAITVRMYNKKTTLVETQTKVIKFRMNYSLKKDGEQLSVSATNSQSSQFENIMRIEDLTKKMKQLEKDKQHYKDNLDAERSNKQKLEADRQEIKDQTDLLKKNNEEKEEEIKKLQQEKEKFSAEKLFFLQVSRIDLSS